jgi:hypothetical protein
MILRSCGQTLVLAAEQHKRVIAGGFEASVVRVLLVLAVDRGLAQPLGSEARKAGSFLSWKTRRETN